MDDLGITKEELAIFLAEADEHLQNLDEGLLALERESYDAELLQSLFRAAHTLKGSAGMLHHERMVEVTHELEAVLDGVRKGKINVTPQLIDKCLAAVDILRLVRDEIAGESVDQVDVQAVTQRLRQLTQSSISLPAAGTPAVIGVAQEPRQSGITISADIARDSVASAARALQIMLVLQDMGEILSMTPSQEQIESAMAVEHFEAKFLPKKPLENVWQALSAISEIENLSVEGYRRTAAEPPVAVHVGVKAIAGNASYDVPAGTDLDLEISQDELPLFLAEAEEHLQTLDEGLVQLEREGSDAELLQALFRAAHTLKGAAGMINHRRMVELTHHLETAFDGLRKGQTEVTSTLIDLCLEAVDAIRSLAAEVTNRVAGKVAIAPLLDRFDQLQGGEALGVLPPASMSPTSAGPVSAKRTLLVRADVSPQSIASAARALQLLIALRSVGEIVWMEPGQDHIDRAAPVSRLTLHLVTEEPISEVRQLAATIDEIDRLEVAELAEAAIPERAAEAPRTIQAMPQAAAEQAAKVSRPAMERTTEQTVRTSVERLDNLMNLVGELITDRNRVFQLRSEFEEEFRGDERFEQLSTTVTHIGRITDQLQAEVMSIRMQPVSAVFSKFPRLVRDLARKAGKQINLTVRGEDTELDRTVIEKIGDPLIHLLRNAVDHGIENPEERIAAAKSPEGSVTLTARHEEGHIVISVEDDGKGIDVERVKAKAVERGLLTASEAAALSHDDAIDLIFASGLSTAKKITDISGRGVGMDIVRNNVEQLNGSILVDTWLGRGTRFQIVLPLTLAIVPTLLVQIGRLTFAIPLASVIQTLRIRKEEIKTVNQKPVITLRGNVLSLTSLAEVFDFPSFADELEYIYIVVVRWGKAQLGIMVDKLIGQQELVVKSLSSLIGDTPGISSAAILGDGQVTLIIDVKGMFELAGMGQLRRQKVAVEKI